MGKDELDKVLQFLDDNFKASLDRLFTFLRFKSISADSAYKQDCRNTAEWLAEDLRSLGFAASARKSQGQPVVVGHYDKAGADAPHILFYGHYDVQPADPLPLWKHDPFDPQIEERDGREVIVARGSSDDKGQVMTFIEALRAYQKSAGSLPLNITMLLEGEEESGSIALEPFLKENAAELKADCALICDTSMWDKDTPAITVNLRGLVAEEIIIKAANRDLHSGYYGGAAVNPLHVLARILADLHDDSGHIQIPHFYDGVEETPPSVLAEWEELGFSEERLLGPIGLKHSAGEKGRRVAEQIWARPTAEVNGISGGYQGEGGKTVIPAQASAKLSFRLVHKQNPYIIRENFRKFVQARLPQDCIVEFKAQGGAPALNISADSPYVRRAQKALSEEWHKQAVLIGAGGSIPIANDFRNVLGLESLFIGFALDDDAIHSPNEKYDMRSFRKGQRSWARILAALAEKSGETA